MQLLPSLSQGERTVRQEQAVGTHLPYARHVDDHTIETRDGLLMQTIRLRGLLFETADTNELNYRKGLRDAMLRAIGTSRFALYHHVVRRRVDLVPDIEYPDSFSQHLADRWGGETVEQTVVRQRPLSDPRASPTAGSSWRCRSIAQLVYPRGCRAPIGASV